MRARWLGRFAAIAAISTLAAGAAGAQDRSPALQISGGVFNFSKTPTQAELGLELRGPLRWWRLDVAGGLAVTEEESLIGHVGLRRDFRAGERWVVAPGFAFAFYEQGDGKDLGGSVQFRSALDVAYRITRRSRLGLTVYHLSNASLEDVNPGSNSLVLTYSFDLR